MRTRPHVVAPLLESHSTLFPSVVSKRRELFAPDGEAVAARRKESRSGAAEAMCARLSMPLPLALFALTRTWRSMYAAVVLLFSTS